MAQQEWSESICKFSVWLCIIAGMVCFLVGIAVFPATYSVSFDDWGPEIRLKNFSVSNLTMSDDQISGNWSVELGLINSEFYTRIECTVVYSSAPDVHVVDLPLDYTHPEEYNTTIYLNGSSENVRLRHPVADSMIHDVIGNGTMEFNLIIVALVMEGSSGEQRLVLTCSGVKVSISPLESAPVNATGRATETPVCDLVKLVDV